MSASRASQELAQKTNVNPSVNRQTEATAEDFGEIGQIFDDHADRLDELQNELYHADFLGYYGSLSLLQATYPTAPDNAFAIIVNSSNIPQQIYRWENNAWTLIFGTEAFVSYNSKTQFPNPGVVDTLYFAKDTRLLYLWLNNNYACINLSNDSYYDRHQSVSFENYSSIQIAHLQDDFALIYDQDDEMFYFGVKETFHRSFDNSEVKFLRAGEERYLLSTPEDTIDGFNIFEVGQIPVNSFNFNSKQPFTVWFSGGGGEGTVQSWNNVEPDGTGNITATADDLTAGSASLENSDGNNQDEINEDFDLSITQINEELPEKESKSKTETVIDTGGNYPDLDSSSDIYIFDHSNSQAVLTGLTPSTYEKRIQIRVVNSETVRIISESPNASPTSQILMPSDSFPFGKGSVIELQYSTTYNRWVFLNSKGSGYEPELVGNDSTIVEVDQLGGLYRGEARDLFNTNAVKTTLYTSDSALNTDYPDAIKGESVFCPQTLQVSQKLENGSTGKWLKGFVDEYNSGYINCTLDPTNTSGGDVKVKKINNRLIVTGSFVAAVDETSGDAIAFVMPTGYRVTYTCGLVGAISKTNSQIFNVNVNGEVSTQLKNGLEYNVYLEIQANVL